MKKIIFILFTFFSANGFAQVTFQFLPEIQGRSLDGLFNIRLLNQSGARSGYLSIEVTERKSGMVVKIQTQPFTLVQGLNTVPGAAIRAARIQFADNRIGVITRNDNIFPAGDYDYCFTLNPSGGSLTMPEEQCYSYELLPFAEMHLVEPIDRDTLCNKRPTLSWQPLLPGIPGASYQLVMAEIKKGQNAVEALNYNLPVINQSHINAPVLPFPAIAKELEEGKTYAWQVTAYKQQTVLIRSEVWSFREQCNEKKPTVVLPDDGYRDVEDLVKGNYYLAFGSIKFAVTNPYKAQELQYQIESLNNPGKKIKGLAKVKLLTGKNKVTLALADNDAFKDGYSYIIKLWLPDGTTKNLRFIYKN
jgi:hypothetical protein